jgi:hypothetical protein
MINLLNKKSQTFELKEKFSPTSEGKGEIRKAVIKNSNLPFLQLMFNGDPLKPLKCLITGRYGWDHGTEYGTGLPKVRFCIDFNHIRQQCNDSRTAGLSLDKYETPSSLFRGSYLSPAYKNREYGYDSRQRQRERDVFEFICIMPVSIEAHSFITQDSAKHDIVLTNFEKKTWAWCLQNEKNFEKTKEFFGLQFYNNVTYDFIIDHLSNIHYDGIRDRLKKLYG